MINMEQLIIKDNFYVKYLFGHERTIEENIERIIREICHISGLSREMLLSKSRKAEIMAWRHIGVYICVFNNYGSFRLIGNSFGGRDHSTAMASKDKVLEMIHSNDKIIVPMLQRCSHLLRKKERLHGNSIRNSKTYLGR